MEDKKRKITKTDKIPGCERLTRPEEIKGLSKYLGAIKETQEEFIETNMPVGETEDIRPEEVQSLPDAIIGLQESGKIELPGKKARLTTNNDPESLPDGVISLEVGKEELKTDVVGLNVPEPKIIQEREDLEIGNTVKEIPNSVIGLDLGKKKLELGRERTPLDLGKSEVEDLPKNLDKIEVRKDEIKQSRINIDVPKDRIKQERIDLDVKEDLSLGNFISKLRKPKEPSLPDTKKTIEDPREIGLPEIKRELENYSYLDPDLPDVKKEIRGEIKNPDLPKTKSGIEVPVEKLKKGIEKIEVPEPELRIGIRNIPGYENVRNKDDLDKTIASRTPDELYQDIIKLLVSEGNTGANLKLAGILSAALGGKELDEGGIQSAAGQLYNYFAEQKEIIKRTIPEINPDPSKDINALSSKLPSRAGYKLPEMDWTDLGKYDPNKYLRQLAELAAYGKEGGKWAEMGKESNVAALSGWGRKMLLETTLRALYDARNIAEKASRTNRDRLPGSNTWGGQMLKKAVQGGIGNVLQGSLSAGNAVRMVKGAYGNLSPDDVRNRPESAGVKKGDKYAGLDDYSLGGANANVGSLMFPTNRTLEINKGNYKTVPLNTNPELNNDRDFYVGEVDRGKPLSKEEKEAGSTRYSRANEDIDLSAGLLSPDALRARRQWENRKKQIADEEEESRQSINEDNEFLSDAYVRREEVEDEAYEASVKAKDAEKKFRDQEAHVSELRDQLDELDEGTDEYISAYNEWKRESDELDTLEDNWIAASNAADEAIDREAELDRDIEASEADQTFQEKKLLDLDRENRYLDDNEIKVLQGLEVTISDLCPETSRDSLGTINDLKKALISSPYVTTPKKWISGLSNNTTLDGNGYWEVIVEPYVDKKLNGGYSYLPSIHEINMENLVEHGQNTRYSKWIPITNVEIQKSKMVTKSLGLYDGEISYPISVEYTNELRLVVVDDQYKSWRRYFQRCFEASIYNSEAHDSSWYDTNSQLIRRPTVIDKSKICVAFYKNISFRIRLYFMTPQYSTIKKYDLLCTLKDFSEEYYGEMDSSGAQDLALSFSIVGENPNISTLEYTEFAVALRGGNKVRTLPGWKSTLEQWNRNSTTLGAMEVNDAESRKYWEEVDKRRAEATKAKDGNQTKQRGQGGSRPSGGNSGSASSSTTKIINDETIAKYKESFKSDPDIIGKATKEADLYSKNLNEKFDKTIGKKEYETYRKNYKPSADHPGEPDSYDKWKPTSAAFKREVSDPSNQYLQSRIDKYAESATDDLVNKMIREEGYLYRSVG